MKIVEDVVDRALAKMSEEERRDLVLSVVERMMNQMSAPERLSLMQHVVDSFLEGMPAEERAETARQLVPRLLAQLLQSGGMSVDDLIWAAMGSLGELEKGSESSDQ